MTGLKISSTLMLPIDVAGEAIAILAKRGAGKTNTATVLVEELHTAGVQVVILDPVGAWWGIRSTADGAGEGLPFFRLGGEHGDLPLEQTAGALIADVAVDTGQSLLLDLSEFPSKAASARFVVDFAERLFRRKNREKSLMHLVLEEADTFAPQKVRSDDARMAGAIEQIVRRGRSRGLGLTMVTQRSAVLNKDVLSQADVLIAMRTTSPQDVAAVKLWVSAHDDDEHGVIESLPGLETGEAWVWNPERGLLQRVKIRRRRTFDSSSTPKAGERRAEPKTAAAIDVAKLGAQIAATAERVKDNDPAALRKRITLLERELAQRPTEKTVETVVELIEVPVVGELELERLRDEIVVLRAVADQIESALTKARAQGCEFHEHSFPDRPNVDRSAVRQDGQGAQLKRGERRMLDILARYPTAITRDQLSTLAQVTKGGTFSSYLSRLRTFGYIDEPDGAVAITDDGLGYIGGVPGGPLPTEELVAIWHRSLKDGERRMLNLLVDAFPDGFTRDQLSEAASVTKGGTFSSYLSRLRTNGLIDERHGLVRASDTLFMAVS